MEWLVGDGYLVVVGWWVVRWGWWFWVDGLILCWLFVVVVSWEWGKVVYRELEWWICWVVEVCDERFVCWRCSLLCCWWWWWVWWGLGVGFWIRVCCLWVCRLLRISWLFDWKIGDWGGGFVFFFKWFRGWWVWWGWWIVWVVFVWRFVRWVSGLEVRKLL